MHQAGFGGLAEKAGAGEAASAASHLGLSHLLPLELHKEGTVRHDKAATAAFPKRDDRRFAMRCGNSCERKDAGGRACGASFAHVLPYFCIELAIERLQTYAQQPVH
jgi:hypothetical protein